jgi:hypothetical protein
MSAGVATLRLVTDDEPDRTWMAHAACRDAVKFLALFLMRVIL